MLLAAQKVEAGMPTYREISEEEESFYVDSFSPGQQISITSVIRSIGGQVTYDRGAHHLQEERSRYKITLPPGCVHQGLDEYLAPQTVTLPGGPDRRKLCVYPAETSVMLAWLPGDSRDDSLWNGAERLPDFSTVAGAQTAHEALARVSEEARLALAELDKEAQAFKERYAAEHGVDPEQVQLFVTENETRIEPVIRPKRPEQAQETPEAEQKEDETDEKGEGEA